MICPNCHGYAAPDAVRCPKCGMPLNLPDDGEKKENSDLLSFRQGRHLQGRQKAPTPPEKSTRRRRRGSRAPQDDEEDVSSAGSYGREGPEHVYGRDEAMLDDSEMLSPSHAPDAPISYGKRAKNENPERRSDQYLKRHVNWMAVLVGAFIGVICLIAGTYLFLTKTDAGQVLLARMGYDETTSTALWQVGEERMNNGDLTGAIDYFEKANELDGTENANVSGLLMLGNAYEANDQLDKAEEVYAYLYTDIAPSASDAYKNQVRLYLAQGRDKEAAELLATAYANTGVSSFSTQRSEILPPTPGASVTAGYYTAKQTISFDIASDYTIYYTFNTLNVLPDEGILYTGPLELGEGEWTLRAVSISGDLVSDEMKGTYQIYMPTPLQPDVSLAPGTYDKRIKVGLTPGSLTKAQLEQNPGYAATLTDEVAQTITIYYTIDGSTPDEDSPIYTTGNWITMPGGNVTLKAISVNGYGKSSTIKEVGYKFKQKPYTKTMMTVDDVIGSWKLGSTSKEVFTATCGEGNSTENVYSYTISMDTEKVTYDWGYACFARLKTVNVLVELYMTTNEFTAPRSTKIGNTEDEVVSVYKDYGQVESPSGNRGLYEDETNKGKIYKQEDGTKIIRYRVETGDSHIWQLDYETGTDGVVKAIRWLYEP